MSIPVLVAVAGVWEALLVTGLERARGEVRVVRRCADLAELLAAAQAGLAGAAVVSSDLYRLDREAVAHLRHAGVAVVGLADPLDPDAAHRLTDLGIGHVLSADAPAGDVAGALSDAVDALARGGGRALPGLRPAGGSGPGSGGGSGPGRDGGRGPAPGGGPGPGPDGGAGRTVAGGAGWASASGGDGGWPLVAVPADPADALRPPAWPAVPGRASVPGVPGPPATGVRSERGRIIAVWGPTGAPGRTTTAVTLAGEFAALGAQTLVVDADTYGPSVAQTLGLLDESGGIAGAVRSANQGALDVERLAWLAPGLSPTLRVLTGLPQPSRWPELRPSGLEVLWQRVRDLARWTVVDCGFGLEADEEISFDTAAPRRNGATLSALAAADVVLAVGSADPVGLQRLVRGLAELAEVVGLAPRPRVVVTRVRAEAVGPDPARRITEALARYAGVHDPVLVPDDRAGCDVAMLAGRMLVEAAPGSPARRPFTALASALDQAWAAEQAALRAP